MLVIVFVLCVCAISWICYLTKIHPRLPIEQLRIAAVQLFESSIEYPLEGKIAIVTGSSSGLGKSLALQLYQVSMHIDVIISSCS